MTKFAEFDAAGALSRANTLLPPIVALILLLILAWLLAKLAWSLAPGPAAGDFVAAPTTIATGSGNDASGTNVQSIAAAHLFGITDAEDSVTAPPVIHDETLPTSGLGLVLKGTVASNDEDYSVALISSGANEQDVYSIGDSITSRASLQAVYADRVVLSENGVLTNLKLPKEYKPTASSAVRRTTTTTRQTPRNTQSIQNVVSQNLTKLTDVIRPTPYMQNGQPAGYRVYPGRDRKQFAALGLRPGDIIKDIDGQSLTDPTQAMKIFQSLGTTDQVTVTIERAGQSETLVLKTDQLDLSGEQTK